MTKKFVMLSIIIYSCLIFLTFPSYGLKISEENIDIETSVKSSYGKLPLSFIENKGQVDKSVSYYLKGKQGTIYFTKEAIVYDLFFNKGSYFKETRLDYSLMQKKMGTFKRVSFSLKPTGTSRKAKLVSKNILPGRLNYLMGRDPKKWHTDIPIYKEIIYRNLYNGIDLKIYGTNNRMEYDFIVSPGADPRDIAIKCEGIDGLKIDEKGDLLIETSLGDIRHLKPLIYQKIRGERHTVDGSFRLSKNTFSFDIKNYNKDYPLIIDPLTLTYSTYLGGGGRDQGDSIAVDSTGNAYVTGFTFSEKFPKKNSYEDTFQGNSTAFVTKINHGGDSLIYSTYLGGSGSERGWDVSIDLSGSAYITGQTDSDNFPTKNPYQSEISGETDIFITKLTPLGNDLSFSTYLGGDLFDTGRSVAVDLSGNVYISGNTISTNFPTVNQFQDTLKGGYEAFISKFSPSGNSMIFSTYIGGSDDDMAEGIAIDTNGSSYITGYTLSTDFPVKNAYQDELSGYLDAFITKLGPSGDSLSYSTFLGGKNGNDLAHDIAVDQEGSAYITGETNSTDFATENAYQSVLSGFIDAFIAKLNPDGNTLAYSTYLGGSSNDEYGFSIAVDGEGSSYISGSTNSIDFPTKNTFQGFAGINQNAFVTKMSPDGGTLAYSTYLGGSDGEQIGYGIAVDQSGGTYVTGFSSSTNFPTNNAFQDTYGGGIKDAFVARLDIREQDIWHVDGDISSSGDGSSWDKAFKSIQEAMAVNVASGGDEIWVKKGTYKLSSSIFVPIEVGIYGGFAGSEIERNQRDWKMNLTKVDGQNLVYQCFYIVAGATIDGFTITGGNAEGELIDSSGGGILINQSAPIISNCIITGNKAKFGGGGIANVQSSPDITNCKIINNSASVGGGIFNDDNSFPNIVDCTITGNSSTFYGSNTGGGGITNQKSSPVIANCTIMGNSSAYGGGGILNIDNSSPVITNCTITGNNSDIVGGGIWNSYNSSPDIINCTVSGNSAESGAGGIHNKENSFPYFTNSIIWGNTAPDEPQMYSDETSTPVVTYCDFQGGYTGEGNIDSDPLFVSGDNYHLQESSPCIDKGNNSAPELPDTDFDGNSRMIDGDSDGTVTVDMGADEFIPAIANGDVAPLGNRDGIVNVGDALVALRFALGLEIPTQEDKEHGDVAPLDAQGQSNPDGQINVGDALVILRIALGIISLGY